MSVSSSIWDWVVALIGLRQDGALFMPAYWRLPARMLAPFGWVPTPLMVLAVLSSVSLLLSALYFWRRRSGYMLAACAIWGVLVADTPYAVILPCLAWFGWTQLVRLARFVSHADYAARFEAPVGRFVFVFALLAVLVGALNFWRFSFAYIPGYARSAINALRWDGGWHPATTLAMDRLLNEYVAEIAREASGRQWVFTDGLCDAGIELAANGAVRTVSLSGGETGDAAWRRRGFTRFEDLAALEGGPIGLLRAWVVDRPDNLTNAVFQCAFTFLEREAAGKLVSYGLVMRSDAPDAAGGAAVGQLGERIVEFYEQGRHPEHGGALRKVRFCAMQWRVARAIRRLALELDRQQRVAEALAMTELSEKLDRLNPLAHRSNDLSGTADLQAYGSLTPRERLGFALSRANFALAKNYARPIVEDEPGNPEANFALAMGHLANGEYSQARHYFEIALQSRPDDPAIHNNLAVTLLELGELESALEHARSALRSKPGDAAILNTIRQIELKITPPR